jgi:catechol 2,3-dioxygenase
MGAVTLRVAKPDLVLPFYRDALGLRVLAEEPSRCYLGSEAGTNIVIEFAPELRHAGPSEAGLFHTAILFPTQRELAAAVASVARSYPNAFTGSADHLVSQAFYFDDPEGNGVELYWDRSREEWSWKHGAIEMGTFALDPNEYLTSHLDQSLSAESAATNALVGHVHLSVGNLPQAEAFYANTLGFDVTLNWGGTALFVSAGGYHHHIAMNIWRSRGAGRRQQTLGLGELVIKLQDDDSLGATRERITDAGAAVRDASAGFSLDDPWGNTVRVELAS